MRRLLLYSGGADSTLILYKFRPEACLFFQYGQKHSKEIFFAQDHCKKLGIPLRELRIPKLEGSELTGGGGGVVVPSRNLVFLSVAANYAVARGFDFILMGANEDDHSGFPDCRPDFYIKFQELFVLAQLPVEIQVPLVNTPKKRILKDLESDWGVMPKDTWSCYQGGEQPCGECGACKLRA